MSWLSCVETQLLQCVYHAVSIEAWAGRTLINVCLTALSKKSVNTLAGIVIHKILQIRGIYIHKKWSSCYIHVYNWWEKLLQYMCRRSCKDSVHNHQCFQHSSFPCIQDYTDKCTSQLRPKERRKSCNIMTVRSMVSFRPHNSSLEGATKLKLASSCSS